MMMSRKEVLKPFEGKKSYMEDRIASGVEANRKGTAFLTIADAQGRPVPDVKVKITQKSHEFKYGANLFMLDEIPNAKRNAQYKTAFAQAFNLATLPFYWDTLEPEQGKPRYAKSSPKIYRRPTPDLCLEFCEANKIEPKAHCLNYASLMPQWAKGSVTWEKQCLEKRFRELAERYSRRIPMWEVTNETFWVPQKYSTLYRQPDLVEWSFALAERYFPANTLLINEAHCRVWDREWFCRTRSPYYMQIERALMKGARIDMIGMQFHMFYRREDEARETAVFYDPEQLYDVMDTYALLGKPLQITELTIPAYSGAPEDEEVQAEIVRNLYRIWFSHPAMTGIVYWNLADGYAYNAEPGDMTAGENYFYGGLLRFDMTPKPAFRAVRDLFEKEFRTTLALRTNAGTLSFRGFYGDYELEFAVGGKKIRRTIRLGKELDNHFNLTI